MNVLTIDIEEWFHLLDLDVTRTEDTWGKYEVRIYDNVERVLKILDETNTKATFLIIGWIAKTYPDIVRMIAKKYQVGSHTMLHQLVWQQTPEEFRKDVESSIKLLEDITGKKVTVFRAPGFSIRQSEGWAFEILSELGIITDCSVFPAHHAHGGMPYYCQMEGSKIVPSIIECNGLKIKEFPVSVKKIAGKPFIYTGGGYFRLFPYTLIKQWSQQQPEYLLSYIHPRDLDPKQPRLEGLTALRKFKSYVGLNGAEEKLRKYLRDFEFTDIDTAEQMIDWTAVPVIKLV